MAAEYDSRASGSANAGPSGWSQSSSRRMSHSDAMRVESSEAEAGPSRVRRSSQANASHAIPGRRDADGEPDRPTPSSPTTALSPKKSVPPIPHLDLATYPTQRLLRLLASLLQHIASANDQLRPDLDLDQDDDQEPGSSGDSTTRSRSHSRASTTSNPPGPSPTTALFTDSPGPGPPSTKYHTRTDSRSNSQSHSQPRPASPSIPSPIWPSDFPLFTASKNSLSHPSSLLAFHARHIPSISIEAYLLRILKYCPTTNEVFLGLLVYFDRMTRLGTSAGVGGENAGVAKGRGFAIDSYNVHRLVIAGVTVASKFFSDVFYTNSRYAKVGGLPPHELNQLELQFLLLNDFRLRISVEEMQRYGDRLLAYGEEEQDDLTVIMKKERESKGEREKERKSRPTHTRQPTDQVVATVTAAVDEGADPDASQATTVDSSAAPAVQNSEKMDVEPSATQKPVAPEHPSAPKTEPTSRRTSHSSYPTQDVAVPSTVPTTTKSQTYPPPSVPSAPMSKNAEQPLSAAAALAAIRAKDKESRAVSGHGSEPGGDSGAVSSGLREWVRGDDVMGVVGNRITSPMRD